MNEPAELIVAQRMKPYEIKKRLGDLPYMRLEQGEIIYDFIHYHHLSNCLELGFYHGVSSAYIAGAIQELGDGSLTTIDLQWARELQPNIHDVLISLGLEDLVTVYYEPTSYSWRLMKFLESGTQNEFDLCYIDGGHTWQSTGFAFFLVSRLLKPGGWIIFDDLDWTHRDPTVKGEQRIQEMPPEERGVPQVRKVYELLVKMDKDFCDFFVNRQWGFARKRVPRCASKKKVSALES
jgi:predicted O-methyltransferase YrrM